ncbi:glycosyltransferase [Ramlibacter sp. AN1015]|uniref:glycosyltransferase n=1 Tax=Ramlibacter sp. AN1015 TaxID=3133428 RepID=UPI004040A4A8
MRRKIIVVRQYRLQPLPSIAGADNILNTTHYGASNARNVGLRLARATSSQSDYFAFPDDDCYYSPDAGAHLLAAVAAHVDVLFGDVRDPDDRFRMGMRPLSRKRLALNYVAINCPSFFIRAPLLDVLTFSPDFGPGAVYAAVEETELFLRISRSNPRASALYVPGLKIFHPYEKASGEKLAAYSYAQGVLLRSMMRAVSLEVLVYVVVALRPVVGYLAAIPKGQNARRYYSTRVCFIVRGLLKLEQASI